MNGKCLQVRDKTKKVAAYFITGAAVSLIIYMLMRHGEAISKINMNQVRQYILSYGKFSAICFLAIFILKPVILVVPASLFAIAAGNIFGLYASFALSMLGSFGAATVAFYMARFLGKSFVDKFLKGKTPKLDQGIENHGFFIMLIMRLSFIFPHDPLSFAAGLTKMKYSDFILGTLLGIIPEMFSYALVGSSIGKAFDYRVLLVLSGVIVIAIISAYAYKSRYGGKVNK